VALGHRNRDRRGRRFDVFWRRPPLRIDRKPANTGEEHDARAEPSVAGDTIRGMDSVSSRGATAMIARPPIGKVAA
jgi:hypothetical protein